MSYEHRQYERYIHNAVNRMISSELQTKYFDSIDLVVIDPFIRSSLEGFCLLAITNKSEFHEIDHTIVINERLFGLYTMSWEELFDQSCYHNPASYLLFNSSSCYRRDLNTWYYFLQLSDNLKKNIFNDEEINLWISKHFIEMLKIYDELLKCLDFKVAFKYLFRIITRSEYIIYMLNKKVMPYDLKSIQKEILKFKILPEGFREVYEESVRAYTINDIRESCLRMIIKIKNLLDSMKINYKSCIDSDVEVPRITLPIKDYNLSGICQFMFNRFNENMENALCDNNNYLCFMTLAKCQLFYNEMHEKHGLPPINLISQYNPYDILGNLKMFNRESDTWDKAYRQLSEDPHNYCSVFDLEDNYHIVPIKKSIK